MKKITDSLYYVGVNDRVTHRFEALWPIPMGVSYNSYIVKGAEKTALIDTVEIGELDSFRRNIRETLGTDAPDFLVVNHMEPDHSGSIGAIVSAFPAIKIVGNAKTLDMLKGFHGIEGDDRTVKVADGDTIDLGGITLSFRLTPMVHWPETMMTWCEELGVLFSGDAFGCFGALDGAVVDSDMDTSRYFPEMERYYSSIVGKYGQFVQKALARFAGFDIKYICSTHGPVWHDEIPRVIGVYDRFSRYEAEDGVTIVYGSMYGNTARMAEEIASRLSARGVRRIRVHNAATSDLSYILADIFRYRGLVIGGPSYNNTLFPPVESVLDAIENREVRNRIVGTFGSCAWGPSGLKRITQRLESCKLLMPEIPAVSGRHAPDGDALAQCRAMADAIADSLQQ